MTNSTNSWSLSLGIASASSASICAPGVQANLLARACYERKANGQYEKGTILNSEAIYALSRHLTDGTSNAKLHRNAQIRSDQLTSLRLIAALESLPKDLRSGLSTSGSTPAPRLLTDEQKRFVGNNSGFKNSFHSFDSMASRRAKERFDAKLARPNWQVKWAEKRDAMKAGKCPYDLTLNDLKPNFDRNGFAVCAAGGGKRISSMGDAVNAITTMTVNSLAAMAYPSADENSIKHSVARCVFTLVSLGVLALNGFALRSIVDAIDETDKAELFKGLEVTDAVGWFWLMPIFHGTAFVGQLAAVAAVDKGREVDVQDVIEAESKKNQTLVKASNMINAIRKDKALRTIAIEGLDKRISRKHSTNGVPKVWLKLEKATTPAELQKAIAEYLTEDEPGIDSQLSRLKRESHILNVLKLAESDRTEESEKKLYESGRNYTERKFGKANEVLGKFVARNVYKLSGKGKIESVAKLAKWIETHSDAEYRQRRHQSLLTAEGRIGHRYHPMVVRVDGGPLSKALVNVGYFVRDFGRHVVLSMDTNLARMIRNVVQHLWEGVMGSHASMIMCHTFGMIAGWLIVGAALVGLSQGLEAIFGVAAGMLTTDGSGFGVGFASLTFAYGIFAAAGCVFMLAGMGLARMGL